MEKINSEFSSISEKNNSKDQANKTHLDTSLQEHQKFISNQIINYLYLECAYIDLFSIYELESLISFTGYNKQKTLYYLEKYSKEELIILMEEANLTKLRLSNTIVQNPSTKINDFTSKKEVHYIASRSLRKFETIPIESAWSFINSSVNLIDLKDVLNSYDHFKLIKKAKSIVKDKDSYKLNEYFERYAEMRERKFKELFKRNLEDNDLLFLEGDVFMNVEVSKKTKKNLSNNLTETLLKSDLGKFIEIFTNTRSVVKNHILEYLDIFSVGKLSQCNKVLYKYLHHSRDFSLESIAKKYCVAIFKNTGLYLNDAKKIKEVYKNFLNMLLKRPRVRYSGVYYSKVKFNKLGDNYGGTSELLSTVIYYRVYRFLPNGEIFTLTTPYYKQAKLQNAINKNNVEMRRGRYFIDLDDSLIAEIQSGSTCWVYKFKIKEIIEYPDLKFQGIELVEYGYREDNQFIPIVINQYFPKIFKFRSLDVLKNDIFLKHRYE
jgi:hypothetical protein